MIALAALLLAGGQPSPSPGWLSGSWVRITDASRQDDQACVAEESKAWHGDGSFDDASGSGHWRLSGTRLTEISDDGEAQTSSVRRLSPNRAQITDADGDKELLARCRR